MTREAFKAGMKAEVVRDGALGWEHDDEILQAGLRVGDVVTIEDFDESDYSVRVFESVCDTWISGYHFKSV